MNESTRKKAICLVCLLFGDNARTVTISSVESSRKNAKDVRTKAVENAAEGNPHIEKLRKIVAKAPLSPGVYRWLNEKGEVLYVGKAKNLRNRLKSYVQANDTGLGPWKIALVGKIADVDMTVTETEVEALILEMQIVKEIKPKYNVLLKDDKNYIYVRVSMKDAYPVVDTVRQMESDGAKYFGPYLSAYRTKLTLDMLQDVLNYRICKRGAESLNKKGGVSFLDSPCLDSQIGKCNGACFGAISAKDHAQNIDQLLKFFAGDRTSIAALLQEKMVQAAADKKFEKAAKLRDSLQYIESLDEKQIVSDTSREDIDVLGIALHTGKAHIVLLKERNGKVIAEQQFALSGQADTAGSVAAQFIPQYYAATEDIPNVILISEQCEQVEVLEEWLSSAKKRKVSISVPERGKKAALLAMAQANANQKIMQQLSKWEAAARNIEHALTELQSVLGIENELNRIEGYDISHLGGTETVAGMTVIKNGKPANDQYRSFTLRTIQEGEVDDYKSLQEALRRRLNHLVRNIRQEEEQWKEKGVTFGVARKAEQNIIVEILESQKDTFFEEDINYKEFIVARCENDIVAMARICDNGGSKELCAVWTHEDWRGKKLGQLVIRKLLRKVKKGKVYLMTKEHLQEYYASVGFQVIRSAPKALKEEAEKAVKKNPKLGPVLFMMFDLVQNKEDVSLSSKPDLLVIDGGKGQLNSIVEVLREYDLSIPVIGLAKREEEVFVPGSSLPVEFEKDSQARFLLMRLRDEAHRFANRHREKRGKAKAVHSALDDVPGIGDKTKKALLKAFGSVMGIRNASDDDLKMHVSQSQIEALRRHL